MLIKNMKPHIQVQHTPNRINSKQPTPRHTLIELSKAKDQENLENSNRGRAVQGRSFQKSNRDSYHQVRTAASLRHKEAQEGFLGRLACSISQPGSSLSKYSQNHLNWNKGGLHREKHPAISCFYPYGLRVLPKGYISH